MLLLSESVVVLLLLLRRQTEQISVNVFDWTIAFSCSFLVLLINQGGDPISYVAGTTLLIFGVAIHLGAKLSLRRSFGIVAANRGVKLNGLYAFVRHPMYTGYILSHIGFLLVEPSFQNLIIYAAVWSLLVMRIFAEERVLSQNADYREFQDRVRYRLFPGIF